MRLGSCELGVVFGLFCLSGCAGDEFADGGVSSGGAGGAGAQGGSAGTGGAGQGASGGEGQGGTAGSGGATPPGCDPTALGAAESLQASCGVFVDATSGSDDGMGTPDAPFASIARALEESAGRIYLCAAGDPYAGTAISKSVALLGGLDCVTWTYTAERAVIGSSEAGGASLHLVGQAEVRIEDVDVVAPNAVAPGASSIAVLLDGADVHLTISRALLSAGFGAQGAVGASPPAVAAAPGGSGGSPAGGATAMTPGGTNICGAVSRIGGAGAPGGSPNGAILVGLDGSAGDGGAGAPGGTGQPQAPQSWSCAISGKGADGANGNPGNPGYGGGQTSIGNLTSSGFELAAGGNGSAGQPGHSGGGGGSSRGGSGIFGADGGGGGAAGCGGQPGSGGKAGGSSIAIAMVSGVVTLEDVVLRTSAGGDGGVGGGGQPGQLGGPGGSGGPAGGGLTAACEGGEGGNGGRGGNGGGGHGGLSVGILQNEGAIVRGTVTWDDANATPGEGGQGGSAPGATPGQAGDPGFTADSFVLP